MPQSVSLAEKSLRAFSAFCCAGSRLPCRNSLRMFRKVVAGSPVTEERHPAKVVAAKSAITKPMEESCRLGLPLYLRLHFPCWRTPARLESSRVELKIDRRATLRERSFQNAGFPGHGQRLCRGTLVLGHPLANREDMRLPLASDQRPSIQIGRSPIGHLHYSWRS